MSLDIVAETGNIVAKNGNNVEATFDVVERIVRNLLSFRKEEERIYTRNSYDESMIQSIFEHRPARPLYH